MIKRKKAALEKEKLATATEDEKMQQNLQELFVAGWAKGISGCLMMSAIAVPFVLFLIIGSISGGVFFFLLVICVFIAFKGFSVWLSSRRAKDMTNQLVSQILAPVLKEVFGSDMSHEMAGRIPDNLINAANFVGAYDSIHGNDLVRGHYNGVPIMFSDIEIEKEEEEYDAEEGEYTTRTVRLFKGFWVVVDFGRELTSVPLNIHEDGNRSSIQMESIAFNKKFSVHCSDEHTAFYILTPHFMERILEVEKKADGRMYFQFNKNMLQIAVHNNKDQFEAKRFSSPDVVEMRTRFRSELKQITDVIDEIMRHERLFGGSSA